MEAGAKYSKFSFQRNAFAPRIFAIWILIPNSRLSGFENSLKLCVVAFQRRNGLYMNELQLKMCDIQGRLFELSGANGYDSVTFIKAFMTGEVAKGLDSKFNRMQWAGEEYLLAEIADNAKLTKGGTVYDKEVLYWAGYLYRFWHFATGEDSKEIYRQAPAETMSRNWLIFHTLAPEVAIEDLKEIYRQRNG